MTVRWDRLPNLMWRVLFCGLLAALTMLNRGEEAGTVILLRPPAMASVPDQDLDDASHCGREHEVAVLLDQLTSPCDLVFDSLTGGLTGDPELQVLRPVVVSDPVLVVNVLALHERSADDLLHDEAVLENTLLLGRFRGMKPHRCTEDCVCPLHDQPLPLIYWPHGDWHACQDPQCENAHGMF